MEVAHVHRNLVVTRSAKPGDNPYAVVFELWNRFLFTRADAYAATWELVEDGAVTKSGAFETPAVEPLKRGRFTVPGLAEALAAAKPGSFLGRWRSTVTEQLEAYVRPQDNGYKTDVRWAQLTAKDGTGVRFSASEPLFVQALHYGWEDMEFARHRNGQQRFRAPLVARPEVCLNLDVRQTGLGGASCGPEPMKKYVFPIEKTAWTLRIEPVAK